jgi:hypothetical protein
MKTISNLKFKLNPETCDQLTRLNKTMKELKAWFDKRPELTAKCKAAIQKLKPFAR